MTSMSARTMNQPHPSSGARLVSSCGRNLALRHTALTVRAAGGVAEVVLTQHYLNPFAEPLQVRYEVPLPSDAAVGGFDFTLDGERIRGRVHPKRIARERFEEALVRGQTAALLDQERSSLFRQEVGNIPAGAELICELRLDQKLRWLEEGRWEWRFPTVAAPRYLGAHGVKAATNRPIHVESVEDTRSLSVDFQVAESVVGSPYSPSHALLSRRDGNSTRLQLGEEPNSSNRDMVVVWQPEPSEHELCLERGRGTGALSRQAFGLLTLTAADAGESLAPVTRELIVLLDTSGSMAGAPMRQAKRVTRALIESLNDDDLLEMVEFSWRARRWQQKAQPATAQTKTQALAWLDSLEAGGGTEMHDGIREAMRSLNPASQRQIVLVSDGLIGFEQEVVAEIANNLPENARFFTVGVGSAVNRSLTGPAARAGRGSEFIAALSDDAEEIAQRIVARTCNALIVDLHLSGSALLECAPERLPDVYTGCPLQLALRLKPEGGTLELTGRSRAKAWSRKMEVKPVGSTAEKGHLQRLFARECVEDLELRRAMGASTASRIEELGMLYQIATSQTSWLAKSENVTVDPTRPTRHQQIGQPLPFGMNAAALGLRSIGMPPPPPMPAGVPAPAFGGMPRRQSTTGAPPPSPPPAIASPHLQPGPPMAPAPVPMSDNIGYGDNFDSYEEGEPLEEDDEAPISALLQLAQVVSDEPEAKVLSGRIVLMNDAMLVIAVVLEDDINWNVSMVQAVIASGAILDLTIDKDKSTSSGHYHAGQQLRLTLGAHIDQRPEYLILYIDHQPYRLELS